VSDTSSDDEERTGIAEGEKEDDEEEGNVTASPKYSLACSNSRIAAAFARSCGRWANTGILKSRKGKFGKRSGLWSGIESNSAHNGNAISQKLRE
jgi:hypothetical protein